jgi:MoxR-like ATPase
LSCLERKPDFVKTAPIVALRGNLEKVILGKPEAVEHLLIALIAGGHILMEDVPGVGKTTLARALSLSLEGRFSRIQFTPDLLPADVLGVTIYNSQTQDFEFKKGPVFANVLLADEINRASPRTQSALLQAMSESRATVDGTTYELEAPFMVIATQNPVEFHGTYPLPEAQLDRFMLQTSLGYPTPEVEVQVLFDQSKTHPLQSLQPVVDGDTVVELQKQAAEVKVEESIARYMVSLVEATRGHASISVGASPRGSLALFRASRARALMQERDYVLPDDVKALARSVLGHRLVLDVKARYSGVKPEDVVQEILSETTVPS